MEITKGDEVELVIENLSGEGKTVARRDGLVFFVEQAVPGDTVRAKIWKLQKNFVEARAVEILKPSPLRTTPQCKHFGVCGGCKWQHLSYPAQLTFKRQLVIDAFRRIGGFNDPDVRPVIGCESPLFYRNKMEFTFSRYRWLMPEEMPDVRTDQAEELAVGLHVPKRYDKVVNIEECYLQSEVSSAILNTVREIAKVWKLTVYSSDEQQGYLRHLVIRDGKRTGEMMVNLVTSSDWPEGMEKMSRLLTNQFPQITTIVNNITARRSMVAIGEQERVYYGPGFITEKIGDYTFRVSANSFFQTNTAQAERLYAVAKELAALTPTDVVYDLYSGTGTIAIYLSDAVERVVGIEVVESAIADAEMNARINHVGNCYFLQGDLKDRLTKNSAWLQEHPRPTVIIADPPRSGMHPKVVEQIIKQAPARIVYVSCNPSTQARDARQFAENGYRLLALQPVDMFPHTDHVEVVAAFAAV
jgi:23S rRNA (uracil1939-C5)-methyltransferase